MFIYVVYWTDCTRIAFVTRYEEEAERFCDENVTAVYSSAYLK